MIPFTISATLPATLLQYHWLGWTNNDLLLTSLVFTISALIGSLLSPIIAKLFKLSKDSKIMYIIGISLSGFGFLMYAIIPAFIDNSKPETLLTLNIATTITQIGSVIFSSMGINNIITKWFPTSQKGKALGFIYLGIPLGSMILQPILLEMVTKFSIIRGQAYLIYIILSLLILISGFLIIQFMCHKPIIVNEVDKFQDLNKSCNFLDARKCPVYWTFLIGYLFLQISVAVFFLQIPTFINSSNVFGDQQTSNNLWSKLAIILGASSIAGSLIGGYLNDKVGPKYSMLFGFTLLILTIPILFSSIKINELIYLYPILFGLSTFMWTSTPAFLSSKLFGAKQSGTHLGMISVMMGIGFSICHPISASIIGNTNLSNKHELFEQEFIGNFLGLFIFLIVFLFLAASFLLTSISIILKNNNADYFLEYIPSKTNKIKFFNFKLRAYWYHLLNILFKFNILNSKKWNNNLIIKQEKINSKLPLIKKNIDQLFNQQVLKINKKTNIKIEKINNEIDQVNTKVFKEKDYELKIKRINKKINKLTLKLNPSKIWKTYNLNLEINSLTDLTLKLKNYNNDYKKNKLKELQTKIYIKNYMKDFSLELANKSDQYTKNFYEHKYEIYKEIVKKTIN